MSNDILNAWKKNAEAWNTVIENQSIPSRKYTNKAIVESIAALGIKRVADLGCGEGWLCRELKKKKINAVGFDATQELIELAKKKGNQAYHKLSFEEISKGKPLSDSPFDGVVFNFSLYQKENINLLFQGVLNSLKPSGVLFIQTLHPFYLLENGFEYRSQWLSDSWKGLPGNFEDGHAWYARTMEDWIDLITKIPKSSFKIHEVLNDEEKPLSLLIKITKQDG